MYVLASENAGHAAQAVADPGIVDILLWGVLPYVALVILIGGTIWRYRTDQFGWTTRSSQVYESSCCASLRPCSITVLRPFSLATLVVCWCLRHSPTWSFREDTYHIVRWLAVLVAAVATIVGMFVLIGRRVSNSRVRSATTRNDVFMLCRFGSGDSSPVLRLL